MDGTIDHKNPFWFVFDRLVNLIASPIDAYRAGSWIAALIALLVLAAIVAALIYVGIRKERRRVARRVVATTDKPPV